MINYTRHILSNGLTVIVHEDHDTPLATVNILYNVGSRNENPQRTGFAHLFEHLMFGGSEHAPDYDVIVNEMGGENNAYTNADFTNYYVTVPADCVERALWLEADRMRFLTLSEKSLQVQQSVVTEEYHQRYMNQPYGDIWMLLRPMCYDVHPYRWCTIGADINHVKEATLDDVCAFHKKYYRPGNAILTVAGNVNTQEVLAMVERLFGCVEDAMGREVWNCVEPEPLEPRCMVVQRDVPATVLYKAYLMMSRGESDFYVCDLLSDVLSNGQSSRMYNRLVKEKSLFSEVNAYITGDAGQGLFVVSGKLNPGVSVESAELAIEEELLYLQQEQIGERELQKVKNKMENTFVYSQYKVADRAASLCYYEWLGHIDWVNDEPRQYDPITSKDMQRVAQWLFDKRRCRTLVMEPQGETNEMK